MHDTPLGRYGGHLARNTPERQARRLSNRFTDRRRPSVMKIVEQ